MVSRVESVSSNSPHGFFTVCSTPRFASNFTPSARASRTKQSMIVWDESLVGNIRPSLSVFSFTPLDSNHSTVSRARKRLNRLISERSPRGYCALKSRASKHAYVTLQRPPPETRTFVRNRGLFSRISTSASDAASAQAIAAKKPAAPPPALPVTPALAKCVRKPTAPLGSTALKNPTAVPIWR